MRKITTQQGVRWRISLVYIGVAVLFFGALGRVFAISVIDYDEHADRSRRNSITTVPILAERGRIFAADGQVLAQSIFSGTSVFINARAVPSSERWKVASTLGEVLNLEPSAIYDKLVKHSNNAGLPIGHFLDDTSGATLRELMDSGKLPGVHFRDRVERRYPKGSSAGQVLGFVNLSGQGGGGIEMVYNKKLAGEDGFHEVRIDARKRGISASDDKYQAPRDGADVHTTIDPTIQEFVEDALARCVEEWLPEAAMCVVMESKTGRILAMANAPSVDPARYHDADAESMKNRALTDAFEPGSI
ncbi:MAG: hypothetical protein KDB07_10200, partial [Planctomycetes bacterium]|nr:hypothetical protein [Planctomycetota bacterium]